MQMTLNGKGLLWTYEDEKRIEKFIASLKNLRNLQSLTILGRYSYFLIEDAIENLKNLR